MNTNPESLIFYRSYVDAAREAGVSLQDRALFYEAIIDYATLRQIPEFSNPILKGLFVICKANIDANVHKYEERMSAVENGKKGGAPKGNKNAAKKKGRDEQDDKTLQKAEPDKISEEKDIEQENTHGTESEEKNISQVEGNDSQIEKQETAENNPKTTPKTTINENVYDNVDDNDNKNNISNVYYFLEKEKKENKEREIIKEQPTLQERNLEFYKSLIPYVRKYGLKAIQDFYIYWGEPNREKNMLRFEMEKTWLLEPRLVRWMSQRASIEARTNGY